MMRWLVLMLCCAAGAGAVMSAGQKLAPPAFTADQARRGEALYKQKCLECHGDDLSNGEFGPPLKGRAFREQWGAGSAAEPFAYISGNMPPDSPGGLGRAAYADLLAFILSKNGLEPTTSELPSEPDRLERIGLFP